MYQEEWEKIISFESLYKAHRRARLGKRHKKEVIEFENNLSQNLWQLHYDLKYGKYRVDGYHSFMIYDPKEREIQAISYRDRVVQHSLCDNFLVPFLEKRLIYDNAACRKGKGTGFAISRLRYFMCEHYKQYGRDGYFVKIDVKKYFNSIDHAILKEKLGRIIKNERVLWLVNSIIDSYQGGDGKGLPMGNQSSQCFALLYLDGLDRTFKERLGIRYYLRYMDDIICLVQDKGCAQECLRRAEAYLRGVKLEQNKKSQRYAVDSGVVFLGWHFSFEEEGRVTQKLAVAPRRRIFYKVKALCEDVRRNKKDKRKVRLSLISYKGLLLKHSAFFYAQIQGSLVCA